MRIYRPAGEEKPGTLLFFHGGGWVTESVDTYNKGLRGADGRDGPPA